MAKSIESVERLFEGLKVDEEADVANSQPSLGKAIQKLMESTNLTVSRAELLFLATSLCDETTVVDTFALHNIVKKPKKLTFDLENSSRTAIHSILTHLSLLGGEDRLHGNSRLRATLSYFNEALESVVRDVLEFTVDDTPALWRIAEDIYKQAVSTSGTLHPDNYFDALEERESEWPYDPDVESEEYYEHQNRLCTNDSYAQTLQQKIDYQSEVWALEKQGWIDLWARVLNACPGGPTLFYPLRSQIESFGIDLTEVPQYLFRTFDPWSSGNSNDTVVASTMASSRACSGNSRTDILSLAERTATKMLYTHMTKDLCEGNFSDNLMSWSSSLLFTIQYAIYRKTTFGHDPVDIKICAVDTRKFALGQFARDMWLLPAYNNAAEQIDGATKFFNFCLKDERYDNGEHISQGSVDHLRRSGMVALASLKAAGLYQLYPELAEARDQKEWTNRVRYLREQWSIEQEASHGDIELSFAIASKCFSHFPPLDMVLVLLAFKARKYQLANTNTQGSRPFFQQL